MKPFTEEEVKTAVEASGINDICYLYVSKRQRLAVKLDVWVRHLGGYELYSHLDGKELCADDNTIQVCADRGKEYDFFWTRPGSIEPFIEADFEAALEASGWGDQVRCFYCESDQITRTKESKGQKLGTGPLRVTAKELWVCAMGDFQHNNPDLIRVVHRNRDYYDWNRNGPSDSECVKEVDTSDQEKYLQGHKECGLKVGDKVKIFRAAARGEGGWGDRWITDMNSTIEEEGEIVGDKVGGGFGVRTEIGVWNYPYFVLDKVEVRSVPGETSGYQRKVGDPVAIETTHSATLQFEDGTTLVIPEPSASEGWECTETYEMHPWFPSLVGHEGSIGVITHYEGELRWREYEPRIKAENALIVERSHWERPAPRVTEKEYYCNSKGEPFRGDLVKW